MAEKEPPAYRAQHGEASRRNTGVPLPSLQCLLAAGTALQLPAMAWRAARGGQQAGSGKGRAIMAPGLETPALKGSHGLFFVNANILV